MPSIREHPIRRVLRAHLAFEKAWNESRQVHKAAGDVGRAAFAFGCLALATPLFGPFWWYLVSLPAAGVVAYGWYRIDRRYRDALEAAKTASRTFSFIIEDELGKGLRPEPEDEVTPVN